jgi:hypothetical protein
MTSWLRLACGICVAGSVIGTLALSLVGGGAALEPSVLAQEGERAHELDRKLYECHERCKSLDLLIAALISGELSLREAARQDRELHDTVGAPDLRVLFSGTSEEEVFCRHMIRVVTIRVEGSPKRREVLRRLEAEFERLRGFEPATDGALRPVGRITDW